MFASPLPVGLLQRLEALLPREYNGPPFNKTQRAHRLAAVLAAGPTNPRRARIIALWAKAKALQSQSDLA